MVRAHSRRVPENEIGLPAIVIAEVLRGRCDFVLKATPDQAERAGEFLQQTLAILEPFQIVAVDQAAVAVLKRLLKQYQSRKRYADVMIAAIAIAGHHIVITRNQKDFADLLPKQQLQNWIDDPPTN